MATEEVEIQGGEPGAKDPEERRIGKGMPIPLAVLKREREEHELTHLPYRSWCAHCVRGRGRSTAHKRKGDREKDETPRVAMDYFYMHSTVGNFEEDRSPIILMVNEATGERYARIVARKGVGPELDWVVKDMSEELKTWGHPGEPMDKLILKSDGEASIV